MDTTASNPQTETPKPPDPELVDRGRWSGNVIGETTTTYEWGTHTYNARLQLFDDGEGHVQVGAPGTPPPSAEEIVADGLASPCSTERAIAAVLADGWGIETDEVTLDV